MAPKTSGRIGGNQWGPGIARIQNAARCHQDKLTYIAVITALVVQGSAIVITSTIMESYGQQGTSERHSSNREAGDTRATDSDALEYPRQH